ncbi:MaoC family dehydratase [Thermogemmatispora carboxidivorans]|uniref:MaoC family dehydratase n=1 Tax=Thermogemmatispora carboxidivorans TaxID=1382306 RepID=UPI00069A746F|nr:MaoC family dehydratase [Thermogemmatispora carboxidivorans]
MAASAEFKEQVRRAFTSIQPGQRYVFRRTFTEGDMTLFCGLTGDYNPYHLDETFAQTSWYGRRILPGLLTSSMITHIGGMLGFVATEMHFHYLKAVYPGETITCTVTFVEKDEELRLLSAEASFVNQDGVEVLQAWFKGFPTFIRLQAEP